jgi:hypothetical protein
MVTARVNGILVGILRHLIAVTVCWVVKVKAEIEDAVGAMNRSLHEKDLDIGFLQTVFPPHVDP